MQWSRQIFGVLGHLDDAKQDKILLCSGLNLLLWPNIDYFRQFMKVKKVVYDQKKAKTCLNIKVRFYSTANENIYSNVQKYKSLLLWGKLWLKGL